MLDLLARPVRLAGVTARVMEAVGEQVTRVDFRFDEGLDDPAFVFFAERAGVLAQLAIPPVGERLRFMTTP